MPFKFYIRLLVVSPLHINKQIIKEINHEKDRMQCFDLGHIALMIAGKFRINLDTKMSFSLTMITRSFEG